MNIKNVLFNNVFVPRIVLIALCLFSLPGVIFTFRKSKEYFVLERLIHPIRTEYQRLPALAYLFKQPPAGVAPYVQELKEKGLVRIAHFLNPHELQQLRHDFAHFVTSVDQHKHDVIDKGDGFSEDYYDNTDSRYCSSNPFKYSEQLVLLSANKKITDTINYYFGGNAHINFGVATRIISGGTPGLGSYQWHHDAWGKKLHVMFLLTDVGENDQYMTYVSGSHKLRHPFNKFMNSRLSLDYCHERMDNVDVVKCTGKAGDIFIFDTNGVHSGNRTMGADRDIFIVSYTHDHSYVWHCDLPAQACKKLATLEYNPFQVMLNAKSNNQGNGLFPKLKTWVQSLTHVNTWV